MQAFYADETARHAPSFFLLRGRLAANEERVTRAEHLLEGVARAGLATEPPPSGGRAAAAAVHSARYLDFLDRAYDAWRALPDAGEEVVANVQPRAPEASYPASIVGRAGWHMGDTACPIGRGTAEAAFRAADCAIAAALVAAGGESAYALCRPPGHHASAEVAAGHCYLNNAAIAAERLASTGARVAVLDIDVHHGNGTQTIFWTRPDILTVSVHGDPDGLYPFFTGRADERGGGAGEGANLNLPLPASAGDDLWLAAVDAGLAEALRFGADVLVLALGLDVHADDPLGNLTVTTAGILRAGERVAAARLPLAVVQEGGYGSEALADNLAAFLAGVLGGRA